MILNMCFLHFAQETRESFVQSQTVSPAIYLHATKKVNNQH